MIPVEEVYLDLLLECIDDGVRQSNRTGVDVFKIPPRQLQHDMADGFPLLTTKKMAWRSIRVELEGFIKGVTSKEWFQERGCRIWDEWCNPQRVLYGNDEETKSRMREEDDLGPCIYGASWRRFHDPEALCYQAGSPRGRFVGQEVDQLQNIVNKLKTDPTDRRMVCCAWNPLGLEHTALSWCHFVWQVTTRGDLLDLTWTQRSCDMFLGVPFNLASYGLLLHLLCLESGLKPGVLTGNLTDVHVYENHVEQAREQFERGIRQPPKVLTGDFTSIFNWRHSDTILEGYNPHPAIKAEVAV